MLLIPHSFLAASFRGVQELGKSNKNIEEIREID
jgi:hypothetical protein